MAEAKRSGVKRDFKPAESGLDQAAAVCESTSLRLRYTVEAGRRHHAPLTLSGWVRSLPPAWIRRRCLAGLSVRTRPSDWHHLVLPFCLPPQSQRLSDPPCLYLSPCRQKQQSRASLTSLFVAF